MKKYINHSSYFDEWSIACAEAFATGRKNKLFPHQIEETTCLLDVYKIKKMFGGGNLFSFICENGLEFCLITFNKKNIVLIHVKDPLVYNVSKEIQEFKEWLSLMGCSGNVAKRHYPIYPFSLSSSE